MTALERLEHPIWQSVWLRRTPPVPEFRKVLRELEPRARLAYYPCIDDPVEVRLNDEGGFEVLTPAKGQTLQESLESRSEPPTEEEVRAILLDLCTGLTRLHDGLGLYHGALNPFNIRINEQGRASLWGVLTARLETTLLPTEDQPYRDFLSPEQREGKPLAPSSDIYSLGAVLQELLEAPKEPWSQVIARCMAANPGERFAGVAELLAELELGEELRGQDTEAAEMASLNAWRHFTTQHVEQAATAWQAAHRHEPLNPVYANNLAVALSRQGEWSQAQSLFEEAATALPYESSIQANLGLCHLHQERPQECLTLMRRALTLKKEFALPYRAMGEAFFRLEEYKKAIQAFHESLRLEQGCLPCYMRLADAMDALGQIKNATVKRNFAEYLEKRLVWTNEAVIREPYQAETLEEEDTPSWYDKLFQPQQQEASLNELGTRRLARALRQYRTP